MNAISHAKPDDGIEAAQAALASVEAAWNRAAKDWNAARLTEVYTADALLFGGRPGHAVGTAAIEAYFASYAGVILSGTMHLVAQQLRPLAADVCLAQGVVDFAFVLAGNRFTQSQLRTTLVVVRQGGLWKILQHHFSPTPEAPPLGR